jgi:nitric oxide synthase-interacting protein
MKPCSHVTCKTCTDTLARPAGQCLVCDKDVPKDGFIELRREGMSQSTMYFTAKLTNSLPSIGTGYAAGGLAETSKKGIAFQG